MIPIPKELLEQFGHGNVLLFIGERILRDAGGQAVIDTLASQLAARCDVAGEGTLSFPEAAQAYEDEKGRQALIQFLRDQSDERGDTPQQAHRLIAGLTNCRLLATTCLDRRLERAFEQAKRSLDVITGNVDVAFEDECNAQLYKLRGSLDRPESLVLTEDDYETFFEDQASISVVLRGYLARKTTLFVGYDLADPHFKRLYRKVTALLDDYARRAYAFGESPPPRVCRWCERHGVDVVEADATAFLESLTEQLAARLRPVPAAPPQLVEDLAAPLPERPYKLLDYYEAKDAVIFFGRRDETQHLTSLIHAHRLVLLYGASGTGKTSLLLAGAVPRLERADPPYEMIYVRALDDPARVIRRAMRRKLPDTELPTDVSAGSDLVDFVAAATRALGRTLVIILDQFEEFFIRLSAEFRQAFIAELGALYDARDVPVKVVLSLREDWLASVGEIEKRIPEVFRTRARLLPLTRDQAHQAITAPVVRLGASYEPALVDRLLDDLTSGADTAVMPPQLQLVCSALYDGLGADERTITLAAYERLDGARGVLQKYLDDELARLGGDEQTLARDALEELVTSERTKAVKTGDELALALGTDRAELVLVLEKLVRARLLRPVERASDSSTGSAPARAYELAHEYLIAEIALSPEAVARKEAEELLRQGVDNRQRFGSLLSVETFELVDAQRDRLRMDNETQELMLRSALMIQHKTSTYWLERVEDKAQRVEIARDYLTDSRMAVRNWTAQVLSIWDAPAVGEMLVEVALNDAAAPVRKQATISLVKWSNPVAVVALISAQDASSDRVYEALAYILDEVGTLPSLLVKTRLQVIRVLSLHRLRQAGITLFYRTLGGTISAAVCAAFSAALAGYIAWQVSSDQFLQYDFSLAATVALAGIIVGLVGGFQGGTTTLGLTLADILVKKPSIYFRLIGGMAGGGVSLGILFVLLKLGDFWPWASSYGMAFTRGFTMGILTSVGTILAIPEIGRRRSLFIQAVLGAISTGGIYFVVLGLPVLFVFGTTEEYLLSVLGYSVLESGVGGGMALGLGIVDRIPHIAEFAYEFKERSKLNYETAE